MKNEKIIEVADGNHIFSLKARYTTWNGRKVFIEYGRDVTDTKLSQQRYTDQIRSILENIPEGQGVFQMDLTADKWMSSGGNAQNARNMQNMNNVNDLIRRIASFVPNKEGQEYFFRTFSRESQLEAYAADKRQIVLETESYYDDRSIRWSRITAHLIDNPGTHHVESIIYGVDISKEKTHIEELERNLQQDILEKEQLRQRISETWELYTQADRDRRYDCLTGLNSRLDLYNVLKNERQKKEHLITAVMMVDIDNFKCVNDTYGHDAGDECLKTLGRTIMDFGVRNGISFYRYGGEEIVGLCHNDAADIGELSRKLLEQIRNQKIHLAGGSVISVTASIGYTSRTDDDQKMISQADRAMYEAKRLGKNQTACLD